MQLKTQVESRREDLNKSLIAASVLIILFSGYIVDFFVVDDGDAWVVMLNLYRLAFLFLILTTKNGLVKEIGVALLINHFIDRWMKIDGWSLNDTITIGFILYKCLKNKKCLQT